MIICSAARSKKQSDENALIICIFVSIPTDRIRLSQHHLFKSQPLDLQQESSEKVRVSLQSDSGSNSKPFWWLIDRAEEQAYKSDSAYQMHLTGAISPRNGPLTHSKPKTISTGPREWGKVQDRSYFWKKTSFHAGQVQNWGGMQLSNKNKQADYLK